MAAGLAVSDTPLVTLELLAIWRAPPEHTVQWVPSALCAVLAAAIVSFGSAGLVRHCFCCRKRGLRSTRAVTAAARILPSAFHEQVLAVTLLCFERKPRESTRATSNAQGVLAAHQAHCNVLMLLGNQAASSLGLASKPCTLTSEQMRQR